MRSFHRYRSERTLLYQKSYPRLLLGCSFFIALKFLGVIKGANRITCWFTPLFAEREGFEPPVPLGTTVFKTVVIDHSTISPEGVICSQPASLLKASAKLWIIIETAKYLKEKFHKKWFSLWLRCISCALGSNSHAILTCLKQNKGMYFVCSR